MTQEARDYPGPVPVHETVVAAAPEFIENCKAALAQDAEALGWTFGGSTLTQDPVFGLVWRIDIRTRNGGSARIAIWRPSGGEGFGTAYFSGLE